MTHTEPAIRPIETSYDGCLFRSRLEARWAVFFNHLGIEWDYEPQGFSGGGFSYLPDFYLPFTETWVEVKGSDEDLDAACPKLFWAAVSLPGCDQPNEGTMRGLLILTGMDPPDVGFLKGLLQHHPNGRPVPKWAGFNADKTLTIYKFDRKSEPVVPPPSGLVRGAFLAARRARFEFEETPRRGER